MSGILKRVGTVWFIFSIVTVSIDSAPGNGNPPPGGPPPDNKDPPPPPPSNDPMCFQDPCDKNDNGLTMRPVPNNCTFYYKCAGKSDVKLEQCSPGQLFNKITFQCELSTTLSNCLNCSSTATTHSSSTTTSSTTTTSTATTSTTKLSTTQGSTTSSSTSPGSTTSSSTTTTGQGASASTSSSSSSVIKAETTETTTLLATPVNTTEHSLAINTTSTIDAAIASASTSDAESANSEDTTWTSASSTRVTATIASSTTSTSSTSSTYSIASASGTESTSSTLSKLSSTSSAPTSNASSLAVPSSGSSTSGNPDDMTSSSTMTSSSSIVSEENNMTSSSTTSPPVTMESFRREILFTRSSPDIVSEGTDLEFECAFIWQTDLWGKAKIDEFIWILNGRQVESTGRIVIHQPTTRSPDDFWKSTISFKPILSQDSGNLTCCATTSGFINATYVLYEVLPRPRVTITPLVTTVRDGEDAFLSCTANASLNSNRTTGNVRRLLWLTNDRVLRVDEYQDSITNYSSTQLTVSTLSLTSLVSDVNVTCLVETSFVNVSSRNALVRVIKNALGNPCPAETAAGIDWGLTAPGSFDVQSCPNDGSGLARRDCKVDSTWELPNLDKCIAKEFVDLQTKVNSVRDRNDILDNLTMTQLAEDIAETISTSKNMSSAELEVSVNITSTMSEIHTDGDVALGPTELKAMMQAIDYLLNESSWDRAPQNLSIYLLTTINVYSDMYAQQPRNRAIFIVSKNLVYESDGMKSESTMSPTDADLSFPDWTKVNWTTKDAGFWAQSNENVIYMKRQTALKLQQKSVFGSSSPLNFSSSCIRTLGKYLPLTEDQKRKGSYINSNVISLTFPELDMSSAALDQPFVISAQHLMPETNKSLTGVCVFWNFSAHDNDSWAESGCTTISSNETHTTCSCTHLTNFAILFGPKNADGLNDVILSIISMVGCIISVIALTLTILLYLTQWKKMRSKRAGVLINLCIALIIANVVFLAGSDKVEPKAGCTVVAALLHYFFLAAFFLMLLEGVMLVIYVIFVFYVLRLAHTIAMIVAAWVIPAVIVAISLGVTKTKGYGTKTTCWLSVAEHVLWAFVGPALFIILVNLIIIIVVLSRIARTKVRSDLKKKRNKLISMMRNIVILSPIMGVTWVFGVLSVSEDTVAFQYIFAITNSLQGLFIFILHGLCHAKNKKSSSSSSKPRNRRLTGVLSRSSVPHIQIPLSGTDSQEDLVERTKTERELYAEEVLAKQNSVHHVRFGHQLSNTSHTSNGTALTVLSNTSSSNGRTSNTTLSDGRK